MPPGGWQYFSPQTGWRNPNPTNSTFRDVVSRIINHNRNNPRFNLPTDPEDVANLLDHYTCARLNHDTNWCAGPLSPPENPELKKKQVNRRPGVLAQLADDVETIANGAKAITDWLASGGHPTSETKARARATVCSTCPNNRKPNVVLEAAAWTVMKTVGITELDGLGECSVCKCQLPLKVWFPFYDIDAHTNPKLWHQFPKDCWALKEHQLLTVVIPFYSGDYDLLIKLLDWMVTLGQTPTNRCLLVHDEDVSQTSVNIAKDKANLVFSEVEVLKAEPGPNGWPAGPNRMFRTAIEWIQVNSTSPFMWLETDAVPLRKDWLEQLQSEYWKSGKPYMGHIVKSDNGRDYWMTGVAVYPHNASSMMMKFTKIIGKDGKHIAFDFIAGRDIADKAHSTGLLQHNYGGRKKAPTFSEMKSSPNVLDQSDLAPDAVLYHQCKDGTLIELLRRNMAPL